MKVRIEDGVVYADGVKVGNVDKGGSEVWVYALVNGQRKFAARFKWNQPGTNAKSWAKAVFANYSPMAVATIVENRVVTPAELGNVCGWEMANIKKMDETGMSEPRMIAYRAEKTAMAKVKLTEAGF